MAKINPNYQKLPGSYLFSEIARRTAAYSQAHPEARLIKMGIGDVTLPLAPAVIAAMHEAVEEMAQSPCPLLLYEKENKRSLSRLLEDNKQLSAFAVLTGPEGGFSQEEAALAMEKGLSSVSVGPRILRCETAPLAALCAIMYQTGNFDIGE